MTSSELAAGKGGCVDKPEAAVPLVTALSKAHLQQENKKALEFIKVETITGP